MFISWKLLRLMFAYITVCTCTRIGMYHTVYLDSRRQSAGHLHHVIQLAPPSPRCIWLFAPRAFRDWRTVTTRWSSVRFRFQVWHKRLRDSTLMIDVGCWRSVPAGVNRTCQPKTLKVLRCTRIYVRILCLDYNHFGLNNHVFQVTFVLSEYIQGYVPFRFTKYTRQL